MENENKVEIDTDAIAQRRLEITELMRQSKQEQIEMMEALKNAVANNEQ
jgi:hypothetical protein